MKAEKTLGTRLVSRIQSTVGPFLVVPILFAGHPGTGEVTFLPYSFPE